MLERQKEFYCIRIYKTGSEEGKSISDHTEVKLKQALMGGISPIRVVNKYENLSRDKKEQEKQK